MYLPVEPGRLIEGPVNRGPENRGCTVLLITVSDSRSDQLVHKSDRESFDKVFNH